MNEEIKAKWIEALLSGEYKQGDGLLRNSDDKYCCLGVLCDLYSKDTGAEWTKDWDGTNLMHSRSGMTPSEVDWWAGLVVSTYHNTLTELAEMNDSGSTFEEIVEVIKEKL